MSSCLAVYHLCSSFWFPKSQWCDNDDKCYVCTKPQGAIDAKPWSELSEHRTWAKKAAVFCCQHLSDITKHGETRHDTTWHDMTRGCKQESFCFSKCSWTQSLPAQGQLQQKGVELKLEKTPPIATGLSHSFPVTIVQQPEISTCFGAFP